MSAKETINSAARPTRRRRSFVRLLRKETTTSLLQVGLYVSRRSSEGQLNLFNSVVLAAVRTCLPLRFRLARNMKLAGVYRTGLVDLYFERAADQMKFLMHIVRAGFADSGVAERFCFDGSLRYLQQAYAGGHGVLVISPHLCCYPVFPRALAEKIPCSIYLRRSRDPRKHSINTAVGAAGEGYLVYPPANASRSERLTVAMRVLRHGRALFVTPDLPRKPDQGVPVRILGKTVHFPTGVMVMGMRTKAPIVVVDWHRRDGLYHVRCHEPMELSSRGDRQRRAAAGMARFAELMDQAIRQHPEMWWNWLDKRWTQIIRGQR